MRKTLFEIASLGCLILGTVVAYDRGYEILATALGIALMVLALYTSCREVDTLSHASKPNQYTYHTNVTVVVSRLNKPSYRDGEYVDIKASVDMGALCEALLRDGVVHDADQIRVLKTVVVPPDSTTIHDIMLDVARDGDSGATKQKREGA